MPTDTTNTRKSLSFVAVLIWGLLVTLCLRPAAAATILPSRVPTSALSDADPSVRSVAQSVIWQLWGHSGDAAIDREYQQGLELMSAGDLTHAIDLFSHIIEQQPAFAEAWNKVCSEEIEVGVEPIPLDTLGDKGDINAAEFISLGPLIAE